MSRAERDDARRRRSEDEGENERETTVRRVKAEGTYTVRSTPRVASLVVQSALRTGVALPTLSSLLILVGHVLACTSSYARSPREINEPTYRQVSPGLVRIAAIIKPCHIGARYLARERERGRAGTPLDSQTCVEILPVEAATCRCLGSKKLEKREGQRRSGGERSKGKRKGECVATRVQRE